MEDADSNQNLTRSIVKEESRYCGEGKATGCEGHKCEGEGYHRIIDWV